MTLTFLSFSNVSTLLLTYFSRGLRVEKVFSYAKDVACASKNASHG